MKYTCVVISVADINVARKFYEDLFGLEVFQDYGKTIAFTCGMTMEEVSAKLDVSIQDLTNTSLQLL